MKGKFIVKIMALLAITFIVGCAVVPKIKVPAVGKAPVYELDGLYLTTDARQMTGVDRSSAKLGVGETVVIYARGKSTDGKWFELPADVVVNWRADLELEVTPASGHVVTVKVIKPISVVAYVTATTTTEDGKKTETLFSVTGK